jgi:hypothetical protein
MKSSCIALIFFAILFASLPAPTQQTRVGTFDQTSIVVAYYRSSLWSNTLKGKQAELVAAEKAGDSSKADAIKAWGGESQELAHQQLAGKAPITNILEALKPAFAEIEKSAHVSSVVPNSTTVNQADSVDVTGMLLDWLKADQQTRQLINQLPKN